jgi:endonuclease YncB( thermonuclease family)
MRLGQRGLVLAFLLCWATLAHAGLLTGRVVAVADGDTVTLRDDTGRQYRIRLQGIDAPENDQPHGNASKQALTQWVLNREVEVEHRKRDAYRRILGKILLDGEDINLKMVREGMAWHYKRYQADQRWDDRWRYAWGQWRAQSDRRGLWVETDPMPPWEFRQQERTRRFRDGPASAPVGS